MSVYPCSVCRGRRPGKLASAYWAWFKADGARSAYKLRYCASCAPEELGPILTTARADVENDNAFACLMCGGDSSKDSDPVYLTLYVPGKEPEELALQLDGACAAKLRIPITQRGELLEDRGGVVRGPLPSTSAWDKLGLAPS